MRPSTPRTLVGLLLALVLLGVEIPEVHEHGGATAGLYNEECLLERLAAGVPGATLPDVSDAPRSVSVAPLVVLPPAPARLPLALPPSEARAPPDTL
jgi:hypothetical protein